MAQRRCPECGHIENEFTYFCTECGAKTVESTESSPVKMQPIVPPVQPEPKNIVSEEPVFEPHKSDVHVYNEESNAKNVISDDRQEESNHFQSPEQPEPHPQTTSEPHDNGLKAQPPQKSLKINPIMIGMGAAIVVLIIVVVALLANKDDSGKVSTSVAYNDEVAPVEQTDSNKEEESQDNQNEPVQREENSVNSANSEKDELYEEPYEEPYEEDSFDQEEVVDDSNMNDEFGIYGSAREDYSQNLNPNYYKYYNSGITDFDFWYPADMFNNVFKDTASFTDTYGENIETITFDGSGGSKYIFSLTKRTDNMSTEDMMNYVHQRESSSLYGAADILVGMKEDYGKVIVTGWMTSSEDYPVYDLTKVERDYIIRMYIILPNYTSEEDRLQKAYVVESVYRLCDYADSTRSPRSYEEFLEDN